MSESRQHEELKRLRRDNQALNEQIKLLVQTEQRLYRVRNEVDRQLSRIRELGQFSLVTSRLEDAAAILEKALDLVLANLDVEHAASVWIEPDGLRVESRRRGHDSRTSTAPLDADLLEWVGARPGAVLLQPNPGFVERFRSVIDRFEMPPIVECGRGADPVAICVPLRSAEAELLGFLLACKPEARSYHKERLTEAHLPFLNLLANHLEHALQSAALTTELRERGEQLAEANRQLTASLDNLESTQRALVQARKMEAVGRLAGGIAHDFNNLLTVVLGHAQLLRDRMPSVSRDLRDVANIIEASDRAAEIVSHLLSFSRQQRKSPEIVDVTELTRTMVRMLEQLIGENIILEVRGEQGLARIRADRSHLERIVVNLVINGRDAMPEGGTLQIETRPARPEDLNDLNRELDPAEFVVIAVTDSGCGMDAETRSRIFEPFFTTKEAGSGSGMGLATVYGLVNQNDGHIRVTSEVGVGSCFSILLPTVRDTTASGPGAPELPAPDTKATILFAEDETSIRQLFAEVLHTEGYEVLEASDGEQALQVARGHRRAIDLVVCDVVMPKLGGVELISALRTERPDLPVLFISGYTFDSLSKGELAGEPFLQKPFMPAVLVERVRELLGRRRSNVIKLPRRGT